LGAILAALAIGGAGSLWAMRERARAAEAELRAERERRERIESALEVLFATEHKGQYLILQAASVDNRDAARWADLLATCRAVAERVAQATPDEAARRRALDLADRLRARETELRHRAGSPGPASDSVSPREN
jgi:hypothetical protein